MNYKNKILKISFLLFFLALSFSFTDKVSAAPAYTCICANNAMKAVDACSECNTFCTTSSPSSTIKSCVIASNQVTPPPSTATGPQKLPDPLGVKNVNELIARAIELVLSLVGSISLLMFIYGGLTWMTSAGSADKIKKGRDIIVWAVMGMAVVFTSYILVKFVITSLAG